MDDVHEDLFVVSVISVRGRHFGKVVPILPDWGYKEEAMAMVEHVEVLGLTAIIKVVDIIISALTWWNITAQSLSCLSL